MLSNLTSPQPVTTVAVDDEAGGLTPIHYIIIVLMFYMGGLTILIIKYVQGENEEARYEHYYEEFVKRPQFSRPHLMNQIRETNSELPKNVKSVTHLTENVSFFHLSTPEEERIHPHTSAFGANYPVFGNERDPLCFGSNNNNDDDGGTVIHANANALTVVMTAPESSQDGTAM